jgi:hypothetical protein
MKAIRKLMCKFQGGRHLGGALPLVVEDAGPGGG